MIEYRPTCKDCGEYLDGLLCVEPDADPFYCGCIEDGEEEQ